MANIDVGGTRSSKKPLDANIPLIPFIDLLLCCVMFLLVTAVWNQLAAHQAVQKVPGHEVDGPPEDRLQLVLSINADGYALASTAGDRFDIPKLEGAYDVDGLRRRLTVYKNADPSQRSITLTPDDGIDFDRVVQAMDIVVGEKFDLVSLSDG